ncbi:TetR/AcrR family transcriptional regulator [Gordonia sp. (in: high G+C Gram-positive bacteria)]|uniref:TetR/AcrR family transcriptional regulator n=1 Tax=Gordonia sp. (in: high G+C Gram-positive bacteria) TaxID=84139 RepID=UPI003C75EBB6
MMAAEPIRDRRAERREATKTEILDAAWELVRAEGLAALTLRDLAAKVGMRPPSLYSYFDSKNAIYDAMFRQGNLELLARCEALPEPEDPLDALRASGRMFVEFGVEDPARALLLFLRTIPGFEPSPETYAIAVRIVELARTRMSRYGIPADYFDLWTSLVSGVVWQQIANEPGGDRWTRWVDDLADMFLAQVNRR